MSFPQYSESTQQPPPGAPAPAPTQGSNGLAVAGFVLGILGFLGSFIPVVNIGAILLAVIGAVLAAVGLARSKSVRTGKGLAIAGLVLSVLAVIIAIIIDVAVGSAVNDAVKDTTSTTVKTPPSTNGKGSSGGNSSNSKIGTTRTNPAPIGTSVTGDDWTVKINSVKTADHDSLGQAAGAGNILLVVNMTATYNGHDEQGDSSFSTVKYVAPSGRSYDGTDGSTIFIPQKQFDLMKTLYHGASETGDDMIEIPAANWRQGSLSVSPGILSDDTFVAVK
jgi:hypothetical protein